MPLIYEPQDQFAAPVYSVGEGFFETTCDPHEALFLYENIFNNTGAVITSTTEDIVGGFAKENAFDWFTYDFWKPTATGPQDLDLVLPTAATANSFAIYKYAVGDSDIELYAGGVLVATILNSDLDGSPQIITFADTTDTDWSIRTSSTTDIVSIGVIVLGQALPVVTGLRVGFAPPNNQEVYKATNSISQMGNFIGRSVRRQPRRTQVEFDFIQYDWIESEWRPFVKHYERNPFFFKWSNNRYPAESAYCWTTTGNQPPASHTNNLFKIQFSFDTLID